MQNIFSLLKHSLIQKTPVPSVEPVFEKELFIAFAVMLEVEQGRVNKAVVST